MSAQPKAVNHIKSILDKYNEMLAKQQEMLTRSVWGPSSPVQTQAGSRGMKQSNLYHFTVSQYEKIAKWRSGQVFPNRWTVLCYGSLTQGPVFIRVTDTLTEKVYMVDKLFQLREIDFLGNPVSTSTYVD